MNESGKENGHICCTKNINKSHLSSTGVHGEHKECCVTECCYISDSCFNFESLLIQLLKYSKQMAITTD